MAMSSQDKGPFLGSAPALDETFERIYHENFDRLFVFALKITRSREMARDLVADVFTELWSNRARLGRIRHIESYLFISIKNNAIRTVSKRLNMDIDSMEATLKAIDNVNPEEVLLEKELFDLIERVVRSLPDQCQLILRLAKDKNMKHKEIADELGISVTTVKSQLLKATTRIKEAILNHYGSSIYSPGYRQLSMIVIMILALLAEGLAL